MGGSWGPTAALVRGQDSERWLEEVMLVGLRPEGQFWGWCGSGEELAGSAYHPAASPAPAASHFCRWLGRAPGPGKPALWRQSLLWELTLCTKGGPWGASGRFLCLPPEGGAWGAALCRPPAPALGGAGGRGRVEVKGMKGVGGLQGRKQ